MKTNAKKIALQTLGRYLPSRRTTAALALSACACLASLEAPAQTTYSLSVSANNYDAGFVIADPVQPELGYEAGTVVTVTAYPYGTNQFLGWTGTTNSTDNPFVLTIDSDITLTGNFNATTPDPDPDPDPEPPATNSVTIVWQHAHGQLARWFMSDTNFLTGESFGRSVWKAVDAEDFDDDGSADIVFQHDDGRIAIRLMTSSSNTSAFIIGTINPSWRIVGVTDFDGDGDNDILFQHANANLAVWLMDGFTRQTTVALGRVGGAWRVASVFDFDNDGDQDILFQHPSGRLAAWTMDGTVRLNAITVTSPQQGWRLAAIEDFNGDGKFDFLFQHSDRRTMVWHMDGLTKLEAVLLKNGRHGAPGWRIVGAD